MTRVFKDDAGEVVTMYDLQTAFNEDPTLQEEYGSFEKYVNMCHFNFGGVLENLPNFQIAKGFSAFRVLQFRAGNDDGVYCRDWREVAEVETIEEARRAIAARI